MTAERATIEDWPFILEAWRRSGESAGNLTPGEMLQGLEEGWIVYLVVRNGNGCPRTGVGVAFGRPGTATLACFYREERRAQQAAPLLADCAALIAGIRALCAEAGVSTLFAAVAWSHPRRAALEKLYRRLLGLEADCLILAAFV